MGPSGLTEEAPAKINLYLHVTGKREDGYHLLDSLTVFTPGIADSIHIERSDCFSFAMNGPFANAIADEDIERNLAVRAARLYAAATGKGDTVSIRLEKNIPAGAGLGGGSSDAAAVIRAMEKLFAQDLPNRMENLLSIGADVPVCYHRRTCRFEGIGEKISGIPPLPPLSILIVWPACHSSTQDVFAKRSKEYSTDAISPNSFGNTQQFIDLLNKTHNDLYDAASSILPDIAAARALIEQQDGCLLARMSGSGSAVFGLFPDQNSCTSAHKSIQTAQPAWWVRHSDIA